MTIAAAHRSVDPWNDGQDYEELWSIYSDLRRIPPVWNDAHGGYWILTRHDDVRNAAADPLTFSSADGVVLGLGNKGRPFVPVEVDPPDQAPYRALLQPLVSRAELDRVRRTLEGEVSRCVRRISDAGTSDVVPLLSEVLPVVAISSLVGLDPDEATSMRALATRITGADRDHSAQALADFQSFLQDIIRDRTENPRPDQLSRIVAEKVDGEPISEDVLITLVQGLVLAGHHTTITALSFLLWRVAQLGLLPMLAEHPELHAGAAQESLRIDPPIHLQGRRLTRDVSMSGATMREGDYALLVFASANRDETVFERPDEFDARRPPHHLTFGHGIHRCLGMPLALLEMRTVLDEISRVWESARVAEKPDVRAMLFGHHVGVERLLIEVTPR
jgi:cytochrome P450